MTTKIHALTDEQGRPRRIVITPGQRGDAPVALALLGTAPNAALCIADAAYDSNGIRQFLQTRGMQAIIRPNPTRKRQPPFDRAAYKMRNAIERMFCRLKDFRRIAMRFDKLARNFEAAIHLAATVAFWL